MEIYEYTKAVNPIKLEKEIKALLYSGFVGIQTSGTTVRVLYSSALSEGNKTSLDALVDAHTTTDMNEYVKGKILAAMDFGKNIMAEYGASNVLAGLTVAQVNEVMTRTAALQAALSTGSLYVALEALAALTPDDTINMTQANIDDFRHKIQDFLGIPRT